MTANISIVTLGVDDLAAATNFYVSMGWENSAASQDSVSFLIGHSVVLGLYGRAALAEDAEADPAGSGFRGVSLAINLPDEAAVDAYFQKALSHGARCPEKTPKGLLGWLFRLFRRSGRAFVGSGAQPVFSKVISIPAS